MCGNSAYDWNIMFTGRSYGGTSVTSTPSMKTAPSVGVSKPASIRSSVVLPQPEPPSRQKISPREISSDTCRTAMKSPKRLVSRSMRTYGAAVAVAGAARCTEAVFIGGIL